MLVIENCNSLSDLRQKLIDGEEVRTRQEPYKISEYDKDHIWYKGNQYISLRRFLEVKAEAEKEPCEDAISREDAFMCLTGEIKDTDTVETVIARFVRRIKKLSSVTSQAKTGHWIPVSEKLPEEGKEVLTCSNGGFIEIQSLEDSCADIYWENQKGDWSDIDEVIAWMSLPPCYKPQERSGEE